MAVTLRKGTVSLSTAPSCSDDAAGPFKCQDNVTYACFCDEKIECPGGEDEAKERCFEGTVFFY